VVPRQEELIERVTTTTNRLKMALKKQLQQLRLHVGHLSQRIVSPVQKIKRLRENFEAAQRRMSMAAKNRMVLCRRKLESLAQMLNSLSPLQVLGRGYSITETESGKILQSVKEVSPGDVIKTRLSDGILTSKMLT
jgi:exodeoxyribonuclease VII large subunit